jgi:hypothetical protein
MMIDTLVGINDLVINTLVGNIEVVVCTDFFVQGPHCLISLIFCKLVSSISIWLSATMVAECH